ncbi:UNVERIFIED_CONTAM: hypothetical protein Sindi_2282400 [Sesamum indicum]
MRDHVLTPPGMPQLNSVAERRNRTLLEMFRFMMSFTKSPFPSRVMHLRRLPNYVFISRVFLEKGFSADSRRNEVLLEETSKTSRQNEGTLFEPILPNDSAPALRRSTRESQPPDRFEFLGLTSQLENDPKIYGEAISNIDSNKRLEAMRSEMDLMGSNQVWKLVDPPKGVKSLGVNGSTNVSLELTGRLQPSRLGSWQKDTLNDLGSISRKPICL